MLEKPHPYCCFWGEALLINSGPAFFYKFAQEANMVGGSILWRFTRKNSPNATFCARGICQKCLFLPPGSAARIETSRLSNS